MAGKLKQRFKKGFSRIEGLFDRSPSGSTQPLTSSSAPPALPYTVTSNSRPRDDGQNPLPILPAPQAAGQRVGHEDDWAGLKMFTKLLSEGTAMFGPLKQAMDGVVTFVETFESVTRNREEYQRFRTELNALFHDFPGYFGESTPPEMRPSIANLAQGIERELGPMLEKQRERGPGQYITADQDAEDVLACYHRIQRLFERFLVNASSSIWKTVAEQPMDGAYIISGANGHTTRIWDTYTGQSVGQPLQGHSNLVLSIAYSPDGAYVVSGSDDNTICVWDTRTGQSVGQPLQGHIGWANSVPYSPDGAHVVSGSVDSTIRIWDAHTCQSIGQCYTSSVDSVAYPPDDAYIVPGSHDNTTRIWDVQQGCTMGDVPDSGTNSGETIVLSNSVPNAQHVDPHICNPGCRIDGHHTV
ncbi:hypothetical protein FRC10_004548 [Ceratobasidium sp. 414]|nr:hypothetical protein FRC10_004548 [Ceratobasidium sp. 414]